MHFLFIYLKYPTFNKYFFSKLAACHAYYPICLTEVTVEIQNLAAEVYRNGKL